ncbi:MAG TPA: FecR family protein, partial [Armatimonadota bacterium]|nr:FecR family protein [Armatimonadota bacterium]
MNPRQMGMLAAVAVVGAATSARAQNTATVRSVERLVKAGRANTPALFDAKIGTALGAGDRLRTGGRSAAGMRFPDQSVLRMGELSEVVVTGANRRDTRVIRGQVAVDFKRPGTISGGYAVAAVRGTEVYYLVDESRKRTVVNCYEGRVFVSSSRNGLSAGTAATVTRTTLSDPDLQGTQEWTRGEIVFVDGPYAGQSRRITGFDGTSGTVTFEPSLPIIPEGAPGETGYLLVRRPDLPVVELTENTGTTVREGGNPTTPRRIPREEFAMLQREPFFRDLYDGRKEYVFPGTREMWRERDRTFTEREALRRISRPRSRFFFECCDTGHGENPTKRRFGVRSALQGGHDHALQGTQAGSVRLAQAGGSTPTPEDRYIPGNVQSPAAFGTGQNGQFLLEPFAFGSDDGDALGARVRYQ